MKSILSTIILLILLLTVSVNYIISVSAEDRPKVDKIRVPDEWKKFYSIYGYNDTLYFVQLNDSPTNLTSTLYKTTDLDKIDPTWQTVCDTPTNISFTNRFIITKDGRYIYGLFRNYTTNEIYFGFYDMQTKNFAFATKPDGTKLETTGYLAEIEQDDRGYIYVGRYQTTQYDASIYYAPKGQSSFKIYKNLTQTWVNQFGNKSGTLHIHSISFNDDYSRLYFAWDNGFGYIDTLTFHVKFYKSAMKMSSVIETTYNYKKVIFAFSDISENETVKAWMFSDDLKLLQTYNLWTRNTTYTPLFERAYHYYTYLFVAYGPTGAQPISGYGYLNLRTGTWEWLADIDIGKKTWGLNGIALGDYLFYSVEGREMDYPQCGLYRVNLKTVKPTSLYIDLIAPFTSVLIAIGMLMACIGMLKKFIS